MLYGGNEQERNENMKTLLDIDAKYGVQVLVLLVEERLRVQGYVQSLRSTHQSSVEKRAHGKEHGLCLKNYVEEGNFIRVRLGLRNEAQRVFAQTSYS